MDNRFGRGFGWGVVATLAMSALMVIGVSTGMSSAARRGGDRRARAVGSRARTVGHPAEVQRGEHVTRARSFSLELRQSRQISDRVELFGRASFLQDRFAGIDPRLATDAGVADRIVVAPPQSLKLDAGLGVARETRLAGDDLRFVLANLVARYALALSEAAELANETAMTADLTDRDNWRVTNTVAVTAALTGMLSVKLAYTAKFLNLPVPGFKRTDTTAAAALVTTFARR
jgi:putative salt-induced outer membrane protein